MTSLKSKTFTLLGGICCLFYIILLIITIPIYIYRLLLIFVAKLFRSDFPEIISGQSVLFLSDYFSLRPRSNIVSTSIFHGQFTLEEFKSIVFERWIKARYNSGKGELIYKRFRQFPIKWLGFGFWKTSLESPSIDNHVHRLFGKEVQITEDKLVDTYEKLLNTPLPKGRSPWEFYIVENYKSQEASSLPSSLVIFRFHHILADGYSGFSAVTEGLYQICPITKEKCLKPKRPQRSSWKKLMYAFILPVSLFYELSYLMSHTFRKSSWKIPAEKKDWHQVFVTTEPIPIQTIKKIKNSMGVTFTSVILSATSAAISKMDEDLKRDRVPRKNLEDYLFCATTLPVASGRENETLTNRLSAAVFDLPIKKFKSPCERLRNVHNMLERCKMSEIPYLSRALTSIVGLHCYPMVRLLSDNKAVALTVTNFPGIQANLELNGRPWVDGNIIMGGFNGDCGAVITVFSVNQHIRIGITAERALMSRTEAKQMGNYIVNEIQLLCNSIDC